MKYKLNDDSKSGHNIALIICYFLCLYMTLSYLKSLFTTVVVTLSPLSQLSERSFSAVVHSRNLDLVSIDILLLLDITRSI